MTPASVARSLGAAIAVALTLPLLGCPSESVPTISKRSLASTVAAAPASTATAQPARRHRRKAPRPRRTSQARALVACDSNITVRASTTSCPFAQNVFYAFYQDADAAEPQNSIGAYSPVSRQSYAVACATDAADNVTCVAGDGGEVHFDLGAIALYDDEQAAAFAAAHDLGPRSERAPDDRGSGTSGGSDYGDDYGDDYGSDYGDDYGSDYGDEIPNYDEGNGYRVQCADGMYSKSGGIQGACSGHGGVR
jgi:hypothetical protein